MQKEYNKTEVLEIRRNLEDKLFLMKKVRFIIGLGIVLWGILLWFLNVSGFNPMMLFLALLCEMFINQPYHFIVKRIRNLNWVILLHQILDVILISICIYFLGGADAYFAIVTYFLIIIFAGVIISVKSSFLIAALCSLGYLSIFNLEFFKIIPKNQIFNFDLSISLRIVTLILICVSLFLVACLSSFLAKIVMRKSKESKDALDKLKFAEDAMIQAEKLAVVGQFASGIIHEIKNPLGIILSGVEYLENEVADKPSLKVSLDKIKQSALKANSITKDILNFSRPNDQKLEILDFNIVLTDNIRLLREVSIGSNIQIIKEFSREPLMVRLNNNQFEQVFFNVFMNACEAMPNGGNVFLRTYRYEYQQRGFKSGFRDSSCFIFGEKIAVLEIQDEGMGISEENMSRIFDPFFTTKHNKENAGLGLVICRRIIDAHKGEIEIKSMPSKGTIVIIRLPLFEEKKRR